MSVNIKPLGSRIVIEPIESEEVTSGGIFVPETAKEKPQKGTVVALGPGERNDSGERLPLDVAVGDIVLYAKYAGTEIKVEGKKVLIMKEADVLAILK